MAGQRLNFNLLLIIVYISTVLVFAITPIADTDAWTHLSFGRWIWEHRQIPLIEPFIKTSMPFPYQNWLFGFIYYAAYHFFSHYGVIILKALTIVAAFFVLLKDALRPWRNYTIAVLVMTAIALIARHRFVERPDTFLMFFLPFTIFSLNAFVYDGKKYLYFLPLIHILWANSHTSLPLMFIPFAAFIGGGILQHLLGRAGLRFHPVPSMGQLKTITIVFFISFASSLLSPYLLTQYTHSLSALGSDWWKQEIVELLRPEWKTFKSPYILSAVTLISFVIAWVLSYRSRNVDAETRHISLIHFFLVIPFIWLSFTAVRFIFLLAVVSGPILARNISAIVSDWSKVVKVIGSKWAYAIVVAAQLFIALPALTNPGHFVKAGSVFGFGINYDVVPEAALSFMDRNGIYGKVFNLFQWGGYITWRDFPRREPFIDGRGFLSSDLLEKVNLARRRPSVLDELEKMYGFESIILNYPIDEAGISGLNYDEDKALSHPAWALVYWDDAALVYVKRGGIYDHVIKKYEYKFVRPANSFDGARSRLVNQEYRTNFVSELNRNISETGSSIAYAYLGLVYNESGLYRQAIEMFSRVKDKPGRSFINVAYSGMAFAYGKLNDMEKSLEYYRKALELADDPLLRYKIGLVYLSMGDNIRALKYLSKSVEMDEKLLVAYPTLIETYKMLGMEREARDTKEKYERAKRIGSAEEHFKAGLQAYLSRNYDIAAAEFRKAIEVNPWNPVPYSNIGYIYFDIGLIEEAFKYQMMAIEIDQNYANAHYGLALIYKKQGYREKARKHWEEYLRLEPTGYYSRKAKEELSAL